MSAEEAAREQSPAPKCGDIKRGVVDLRCARPQDHAAGYESGSGDESKWHRAVYTRHDEASYDGAKHVLDLTETVIWEPVDHIAEAVRHMMAGRRRGS